MAEVEEPLGEYDVVSFLNLAGQRYKEHLDQLRAQREAEEMSHVTGRPAITAMAAKMQRSSSSCVQERLHKLWKERTAREDALRKQKEAATRVQEVSEVRDPKITAHARELKRESQAKVTEKFLEDHKRNMEKLQEEAMRREMENILPKPRINEHHAVDEGRRGGKDIADHLLRLEAERRQRLYAEVEKRAEGELHRPKITKRAQSLHRDGDVVTRLYTTQHAPYAYDEEYARHCTFEPNTGSHKYRDPLEHLPVHLRVMERTVQHKSRSTVDDEPPLKPQISEKSAMIVAAKRAKEHQLDVSPTSRLYEQGMRSLAAQSKRSESQASNEECQFAPKINPSSQRIAERKLRSVMESLTKQAAGGGGDAAGGAMTISKTATREVARQLMWREAEARKEKLLDEQRDQKKAAEAAACTPARQRGGPNRVTPDRVDRFYSRTQMALQKREAQLLEERAAAEERERAECTFRPAVHNEMPVPLVSSAASANGVELHWERMERARQQRYTAEVAQSASKYSGKPTTPREFNLSVSRRRQRHHSNQSVHNHSANAEIPSLRPPMGRADVEAALGGDPLRYESDQSYFVQQYPPPAPTPRHGHAAGQSSTTPRAAPAAQARSDGPYSYVAASSGPSAVDFILSNHQNIIRGLQRR